MLSDILVCLFKPLYKEKNNDIEYTNNILLDIFSKTDESCYEEE
tara:strand:- start:610 stop:741 length:132 start_codon:yes stop_codon:yes gene_type:complete